MPLHQFTLGDLNKRTGERRRMVLEALTQRPCTADELAGLWNLHPNSVYKCFLRLKKAGAVEKIDEGQFDARFEITEGGARKLQWLQGRAQSAPQARQNALGDFAAMYPDLGASESILGSPVALLRPIEVDLQTFQAEELEALPTRVTLTEDMIVAEPKFDGWIDQMASGNHYSRRGKLLSGKFPAIDREVAKFKDAHLLGELIFWDPRTRKMNEPAVTSVAGSDPPDAVRKFLAMEKMGGFFQIVVFDVLMAGGQDVSGAPFKNRRELLEQMIPSEGDRRKRLTLSPQFEFDEWRSAFKVSLSQGGEGVVLKNLNAPYFWRPLGDREPRPAGVQWKVKAVRTDNFVVFSARRSQKQKLLVRFGQFWKGELIEVGEVDNLSKEIEDEFLDRLERGPVLVELAFQERFPKPPGRLRNPRFRRFRDDVALAPDNAALPEEFAPRG